MTARRHFTDAPRIPRGLDYQGRHPEATEADTDMGVDRDDLDCASGIVRALLLALALWLAGTVTALALLGATP